MKTRLDSMGGGPLTSQRRGQCLRLVGVEEEVQLRHLAQLAQGEHETGLAVGGLAWVGGALILAGMVLSELATGGDGDPAGSPMGTARR